MAELERFFINPLRRLRRHFGLLRQSGMALGQRAEFLRQRDIALGERNEALRQRDEAIGQLNLLSERLSRYVHRADVTARSAALSLESERMPRLSAHAPATRDRILFFLRLAKTGGVTPADIFIRNFALGEFLVIDINKVESSAIGTWSHRAVEKALGRMQPGEVDNLRAVWGHYRYGIQTFFPRGCHVVTILRDPLDRVVSTYYYWDGLVTKTGVSFEQYLNDSASRPLYLDNYMTRVMSGVAELDPSLAQRSRPRPKCHRCRFRNRGEQFERTHGRRADRSIR